MPAGELSLGTFLLLGLAGALGTWARYLVGLGVARVFSFTLPLGTFTVNVLGSFLMGVIAGTASSALSPAMRVVVMTGLLGGFTTYSAFNNETHWLFETRGAATALGYLLAMVTLCLAAGAAGALLARRSLG